MKFSACCSLYDPWWHPWLVVSAYTPNWLCSQICLFSPDDIQQKITTKHWLEISNNMISHLTVRFFLQLQEVDCYLTNFWPCKKDPYIHCLWFWLLLGSYSLTGCIPTSLTAGPLSPWPSLSAYMDNGWGAPLPTIHPLVVQKVWDHPKTRWVVVKSSTDSTFMII